MRLIYPPPGRMAVLAGEEQLILSEFKTVFDFLFLSVADDGSWREHVKDGERRSEIYKLVFFLLLLLLSGDDPKHPKCFIVAGCSSS